MTKIWEYYTFTAYYSDCDDILDRLGSDGWELVSVDAGCFFLKREVFSHDSESTVV